MKHFTLLFVLFIASYAALAGTSNLVSQDSVILTNAEGVNQFKYAYQFDKNGNKTSEITYQWEATDAIWKASSRFERTYNQAGLVKREKTFVWNTEANVWIKSTLDIYQYDEKGNNTLNLQYVWNSEINAWVENFKYEMAYDAENNQINLKHFIWDAENEWIASTNSTIKSTEPDGAVYNFAIYNKVSCLCE